MRDLRLAGVSLVQDVQALGIRGHDAVLDAVVNHLHEVPGTIRPAVQVTLLLRGDVAFASLGATDVAQSRRDRREQRVEV